MAATKRQSLQAPASLLLLCLVIGGASQHSAGQESRSADGAASQPALGPRLVEAQNALKAALKQADPGRRRAALEEVRRQVTPLLTAGVDSVDLWCLCGSVAIELDRWEDGREAGRNLERLTPAKTRTGAVQKLLATMKARGWLDADAEKVAAAMRLKAQAAARERIKAWGKPAPGAKNDPTTGLPTEVVHDATGISLVLIPAGSFRCGAEQSDSDGFPGERPAHRVTITKPFYLGKFEVTNAQFRKFDPTHRNPDYAGADFDRPDQPVVAITWPTAHAFCVKFGLRLPSDAEWEYAARATTTTRFTWGDSPDGGKGAANLLNESTKPQQLSGSTGFTWDDGYVVTSPVGKFLPNRFGIYDMIGNVWEWVEDWYTTQAYADQGKDARDPLNDDQAKATQEPPFMLGEVEQHPPYKILRGAAWSSQWIEGRVTFRGWVPPTHAQNDTGFRVARSVDP